MKVAIEHPFRFSVVPDMKGEPSGSYRTPKGIYLKLQIESRGVGERGSGGDGEMGCIRYLPCIPSSNQFLPIFYQLILLRTYFLEIPNGFYITLFLQIDVLFICWTIVKSLKPFTGKTFSIFILKIDILFIYWTIVVEV